MHEKTSLAEFKRLLGPLADEADVTAGIGMELATIHKYAFNVLMDFKLEQAPALPAALERMRRSQAVADLSPACRPGPGFVPPFPLIGLLAEPIKIVQAPRLTVVLYEVGNLYRQLYTDGRSLPKEFDLPAFNGYSVGHWEGDALVVETAGFNDRTPLDVMGHPHSEALRVTEHFRRRDFGHLDYEITFDDPKMYSKPFTVRIPHDLLADSDIFEMYSENEKDCAHLGKR
jgi:hypothetical protein